MPERISILGQRFGLLIVTDDRDETGALLGTPANRQARYRCDCGVTGATSARSIRRGHTTSCGCAQRAAATKHGLSAHPLYAVLGSMKARCYSPGAIMYPRYGARGIQVCAEWLESPAAFVAWAPRNGYGPGLEIDRRDNDGNYEPGNCRFVTGTENARNKSDNRAVEYLGERLTIAELAERSGQPYDRVYQRIAKLGWTPERAASP